MKHIYNFSKFFRSINRVSVDPDVETELVSETLVCNSTLTADRPRGFIAFMRRESFKSYIYGCKQ
jgi:hypothetical protein